MEKRNEGSYTEYRHYTRTDNRAVALVTRPSSGTVATRYLLRDHQGGSTGHTHLESHTLIHMHR